MRALLVLVAAAAASAKPQSDTVVPVTAGNDCLSEACVAASHRLFTSMNRTADPCVDFNEFACGRFEDEAHIPDDKGRWDASFSPITEEIYERGRGLMEEKSRDDDFDAYRKARVFYQSCVDEDHLEELGVDPLKKVLAEVGGWPVIDGDAWQGKDTYNWYDAVAKLAQIGFGKDFFVSLQVSTDDKDSLARVIFMDQPDLGIDREYLVKGFDDPDIQSYFRYMNDTAILLGADPTKSQADLKSALLLEIALANASAPREERRNSSLMYNPFILGELERLDGHPPSWTDYVASLLEPAVEITDKERIIVQNPAYLKKMAPIVLAADRRTLANYVGWRAAVSAMSHLNREAKDIKQRYDKAIHGTNERTPTWKKCVREVGFNSFSGASLGIGISSMYVKRFFPAEAKTSMVNMINFIRKGFSSILDNIDWMDTTTRGKAHDKLDQMIQFIGYPDELLDKSKVDGLFAALDIQEGDYLGNVLKLIKWWREFTYKRLRQPVDKKDWVDHSAVALVNAFYNPSVNSIEFPAGILQGAFFDHRVPAYLNFGAIGAVIGHEITHGFDDQGRQYDGEGNLRDWWDPSTNDNFVKRAQCIVEQYGNYSVKQVDLNLNGINTQGENIADNGGIKEAYVGYDNWVKDNGEEKMLPGLGYTPRQMFWISWGQVWCSKYRDAAMKNQVQTGAHSPGIYRIIGPLSNSADFARDFNCPKSTAMNPDNKCTVW